MNRKPTIIFSIEISQRELFPKVHLALEAAKRGYRAYIGDFLSVRALTYHTKKPIIFFHKSTWEAHAKRIRVNGHKFVFLDEEMGLAVPLNKLKETLRNRWGRNVTSDKYDALFTLGPKHQELASKVIRDKNVKLHETGWPRFDLWRPELASQLSNEKPPHPRKYYLFASSFGATNSRDFAIRLSRTSQRAPQNLQLSKDREKSFYLCLNLLHELAHYLKKEDTDLIIRPHNGESSDEWQQLFKEHSNIYIRRGGDLYNWLSHAESLLHAASTVGIQYALTGKIPITLCPVGAMSDTNQNLVSYAAHSIRDILHNESVCRQADGINAVTTLVGALEGQTAAQNILDCLDNMDIAEQAPLNLPLSLYAKLHMYHAAGRTAACAPWRNRPWPNKLEALKKYYEKLDGGITTEQVMDAVISLSQVHEIPASELLVKTLAPQLVSIEHIN